jgi:hypothetical protein
VVSAAHPYGRNLGFLDRSWYLLLLGGRSSTKSSSGSSRRGLRIRSGSSRGDRLCGLVVRVLGYRSGGPGSVPGTTRKKSSGSGTAFTQPREYN